MPVSLSRRALLAAGLGALVTAAAGCSGDARIVQHRLEAALVTARGLAERYATADGDADLFAALRADHEAHVAELTRYIGAGAPTGGPSASAAPAATADAAALREAEAAAHAEAIEQCVAEEDPQYARLLASIAACRATHVEVLGD